MICWSCLANIPEDITSCPECQAGIKSVDRRNVFSRADLRKFGRDRLVLVHSEVPEVSNYGLINDDEAPEFYTPLEVDAPDKKVTFSSVTCDKCDHSFPVVVYPPVFSDRLPFAMKRLGLAFLVLTISILMPILFQGYALVVLLDLFLSLFAVLMVFSASLHLMKNKDVEFSQWFPRTQYHSLQTRRLE